MDGRPRITCLMTSSVDGRQRPERWTDSPDGTVGDWGRLYERLHDERRADGWIVGRVTMAEMSDIGPHAPAAFRAPPRPHHFARREGPFAVALDRSGGLHFASPSVGGDHVVVLLGSAVDDRHLAELVADGVSYVVAQDPGMALEPLLGTLARELGVGSLMLEGGGHANGTFLSEGLVDELLVVVAPALDGCATGSAIVEAGEPGLRGRVALSLLDCAPIGHGAVLLRYAVVKP